MAISFQPPSRRIPGGASSALDLVSLLCHLGLYGTSLLSLMAPLSGGRAPSNQELLINGGLMLCALFAVAVPNKDSVWKRWRLPGSFYSVVYWTLFAAVAAAAALLLSAVPASELADWSFGAALFGFGSVPILLTLTHVSRGTPWSAGMNRFFLCSAATAIGLSFGGFAALLL